MKKLTGVFIVFLSLFIGVTVIEAEIGDQLIIINKATNQLAFFENGRHVKTFKLATGKSNSLTPEGIFPIVNKIKNRPYYKDGIPGGDPSNPLGDRWLGLDARGTYGTTYAIHGNNNPSSIGTYASAGCVRMYDDDVRWLFEKVNLYTNVVITNSSKSFEAIALSVNYTPYSKLQSVSVDQKSPQPVDINVVVTAKANLKSQYRFFVDDGSGWKAVQDFSASSSFSWKPENPGTYQIKAQAKSNSSKKEFDDEKVISYEVYVPAAITSFNGGKEGPLPINSQIDFSTVSNSEMENLVHYSINDGTEWVTVKDFSEDGMYSWNPLQPGTYKVRVRVKHSISQAEFDAEQELEYTIFEPASLASLDLSLDSPQPIENPVIISSSTQDDSNNLFRFLLFQNGSWFTLQDYSSKSNLEWQPISSGEYNIKVQVKHIHSKEEFDSEEVVDYIVYEPASVGEISANIKGIQLVNSRVEITAPKSEAIEYQFSIYNGIDWKIIQPYSANSKLNWSSTSPGMYKVKVEVKHQLSENDYDDSREVPYLFYNSPTHYAVLSKSIILQRRGPFKIKRKSNIG
ncbi:triple tyrosine motif-containing protein [Bacillus sp. AK128]